MRFSQTLITVFVALTALGPILRAADPAPKGPPPPVYLKPGEIVAPFDAEGVDGVARRIDFPKKTVTVLLIFSSGCPHCHKMIPLWNRWFDQRPSNVAIIGLLTDKEPAGFFERVAIRFPVLRVPNHQFLTDYKISRVPLTLRIKPGGEVEEVAPGELDGIRLGQIFRP